MESIVFGVIIALFALWTGFIIWIVQLLALSPVIAKLLIAVIVIATLVIAVIFFVRRSKADTVESTRKYHEEAGHTDQEVIDADFEDFNRLIRINEQYRPH